MKGRESKRERWVVLKQEDNKGKGRRKRKTSILMFIGVGEDIHLWRGHPPQCYHLHWNQYMLPHGQEPAGKKGLTSICHQNIGSLPRHESNSLPLLFSHYHLVCSSRLLWNMEVPSTYPGNNGRTLINPKDSEAWLIQLINPVQPISLSIQSKRGQLDNFGSQQFYLHHN